MTKRLRAQLLANGIILVIILLFMAFCYGETLPNSQTFSKNKNPDMVIVKSQMKTIAQESQLTTPTLVSLPFFPLMTPTLSYGAVTARSVSLNLPKPFFIVGTDANSLAWAQDNHTPLEKLKAEGFVVNIDNAHDWTRLYQALPNITLTPMDGTVLAKRYGLSHYPVLVTNHFIEQ